MTTLSNSYGTGTAAFYNRARGDMSALRGQAETLQTQIGSQSRLTRSSDDPVAASRLRTLARADTLAKIDTANANRATADLNLADSAMSGITDAITQVQVLATHAASGTLSPEQRAVIGKQIASIHDNLFSLANTRDSNGNALFGGTNASAAYTLDASGNAVYAGTANSESLPLSEGESVTRSMTGPEFLSFPVKGQQTDLLATIKSLADALQGGVADPASAARGAFDTLSTGLDAVSTAQTVVGTRLAWIDVSTTRATAMADSRASEENDVGGIDVAGSYAKLQELATVLQASQAGFTRLAQLSLFNQLN
jgi:flagellar hook-associated protein 3 FlgL